jgi:hypothetical protein
MMKIIKKTANTVTKLFIILFVLSNLNLSAQKTSLEFSVHTGGGFEAFAFRPSLKGNSSTGYGGELGVGFTGFFTPQWGIYIGAGFHMGNIQSKIDSLPTHITPNLIQEPEGNFYNLYSTLFGYTEVQRTMGITIPVMLQFQTKPDRHWHWKQGKRVSFYAMGGLKLHFLFNSKYETAISQLYNKAYFYDLDNWADTQAFAGLGYFNKGYSSAGKLNFGVMASLALESGVKWRIDRRIYLYTGVYFDCGLNDPFKDNRVDRSNYTNEDQLKDLTLVRFTDKMNLLAVGIKVRVGFWRAL